jgi:RsiW-degrading membrane proteinase PrsW (M82 family)
MADYTKALSATLAGFSLHPWHLAAALGAISLALYVLSRAQFERAKEDWADAFFYSPSTKPKQRQRRQRWQDLTRAFLAGTALFAVAAAVLYLLERP